MSFKSQRSVFDKLELHENDKCFQNDEDASAWLAVCQLSHNSCVLHSDQTVSADMIGSFVGHFQHPAHTIFSNIQIIYVNGQPAQHLSAYHCSLMLPVLQVRFLVVWCVGFGFPSRFVRVSPPCVL